MTDDSTRPGYAFKAAVKAAARYLLRVLAIAGVVGAVVFVGLMAVERVFDDGKDHEKAALRFTADSAVAASHGKDSIISGLQSFRDGLRSRAEADSAAIAGLKAQRDGLVFTTRTLRRDLSIATTAVDTIRLYVQTIQVQDSTIKVCGLEVTTCLRRSRRLDSIATVQDSIIQTITADRDSLREITADLVAVTSDCKRGEWDFLVASVCRPSSTVVFLAGAVAGSAVMCWATGCLDGAGTTTVFLPAPQNKPRGTVWERE